MKIITLLFREWTMKGCYKNDTHYRRAKEALWIQRMGSLQPTGLNVQLDRYQPKYLKHSDLARRLGGGR